MASLLFKAGRGLLASTVTIAALLLVPATAAAIDAPTNFTVTPSATGSTGPIDVALSWTDVPDPLVLQYRVSRDGTAIATVPLLVGSYTDAGYDNPNHDTTYEVAGLDVLDNAGDPATATLHWDDTPPAVSIDSAPAAFTSDTSASLSFSASDDNPVSFTCQLDGAAAVACSSPQHYGGLADGAHTFTVTASDGVNSASAQASWTVDTSAPQITLTAPTAGSYVSASSVTLGANASDDNLTGLGCSLDGNTVGCTPAAVALGDGGHTFSALATDAAGNDTSVSRSFTVDTTAPQMTLTGPAPGSFVATSSVTLGATASDANLSSLGCSLDGNSTSCTVNGRSLSDGSHTFKATALDRAGNATTQSTTFTVDTTPPQITLSAPAAGSYVATSAVTLGATSSDASLTCTLDTVATDCSPSVRSLGDGGHTFAATATDGAGNHATASRSFTVDTTAPQMTLTGPAAGSFVASSSVTLGATASDANLSSLGCSLDGNSTSCTVNGRSLSDGNHTFAATALDRAGNATTQSTTFTVDTTPPSTPSIQAPDHVLGDPGLSWSSTDAHLDHYAVDRDGQVWIPSTTVTNAVDAGVADGSHIYTVVAYDAAGNHSSKNATVVVDSHSQTAPLLAPLPPITNAKPQLSWTAPAAFTPTGYRIYVNGVIAATVDVPATTWTDAGAVAGFRTYAVQAINSSNSGFVSKATQVLYDPDPPTAPGSFAAAPQSDGSVTLTWAIASDGPKGSGVGGYVIRRSAPGGAAPTTITAGAGICSVDPGTTTCGDTTPASGSAYAYAAFAIDRAGNASAPAAQTASAHDTLAPDTPAAFVATPGNATVSLHWQALPPTGRDSDLAGYLVVLKGGAVAPQTPGDGTVVCTTAPSQPSCTVGGLVNGSQVSLSLFAFDEVPNDSALNGAHATVTPTVEGKRDTTPPGRPTSFHAARGKKSGAVLSWHNPRVADFARVVLVANSHRRPKSPTDGTRRYSGVATHVAVPQHPGTHVYYALYAYDKAGNRSLPATALLRLAAASSLRPTSGTVVKHPPTLHWHAVTGASYYNVQILLRGKVILSRWPHTTSFVVPSSILAHGRTYSWYVWPGVGPRSKDRYGKLIGHATFTYQG